MKTRDIPPYMRGFFKQFDQMAYRGDYSQIFEDFLTLVMCCFAWGAEEDLYFDTIKRYDQKELEIFPKMLGELVLIYENKESQWIDPLGDFYMVLASQYKQSALGQFFTPAALCDIMAGMQNVPTDKKGLQISDPTCGSGRTLLAMNAISPGHYYTAEDLDIICCKMTCVNMMFHSVCGVVIHHNTLTEPTTFRNAWKINHHDRLRSIERIPQPEKVELEPIEKKGEQITLEF